MTQVDAPHAPIQVLFALLPDSLALDWAGPAEALRIANQALLAQGQPARFVLRFVGPGSETVSSVGLRLAGLEALPDRLPEPSWVVLVGQPGATMPVQSEATQALLHWLRGLRLHTHKLELMTVCAGRPEKGMPAWCALGLEMDKIQAIYKYVKARSDAQMAPGRPALRAAG